MLAIVAPGQGAQKPGMLTAWLELDGVPATAAAMSERAKLDLVRLGTTAGADEIKDTAVTQPLVVAAALLGAGQFDLPSGTVIAGHSVGELAAAALAGVLPELDAVELAAVRGTAMSAACALTPTGMSAVMGGETDVVLAALAELDLVGANVNGGGQIVAAGLFRRSTNWPRTRRRAPGSFRCRWPAPSTRHTWPAPNRRWRRIWPASAPPIPCGRCSAIPMDQ